MPTGLQGSLAHAEDGVGGSQRGSDEEGSEAVEGSEGLYSSDVDSADYTT